MGEDKDRESFAQGGCEPGLCYLDIHWIRHCLKNLIFITLTVYKYYRIIYFNFITNIKSEILFNIARFDFEKEQTDIA